MAQLRIIALIGITLVAISAIGYESGLLYQDWQTQAPRRALEAEKRDSEQKWWQVYYAGQRLEKQGARFPYGKGSQDYSRLDLTNWHGTDSQLTDLKKLNLFGVKAEADGGCGLFIVLGPKITDRAVPILSQLHSLSRIDATNCGLSSAGIQKLRTAIPRLIVGEIEREYDGDYVIFKYNR